MHRLHTPPPLCVCTRVVYYPSDVFATLCTESLAAGLGDGSRPPQLEVEGECTYYSPTDDMAMEKVCVCWGGGTGTVTSLVGVCTVTRKHMQSLRPSVGEQGYCVLQVVMVVGLPLLTARLCTADCNAALC